MGERQHVAHATEANVMPPPYYPNTQLTRQEWARYLNSVSGMDVRIGWVLEQLRAEGLQDNTIIIFFADNGRLEPRGIHWCYDCGLRVPLIIKWPKNFSPPLGYQAGGVDRRMVSLIDVTATTLAFAGIPRPGLMQGRVFLGDHTDPARQFAFAGRDRIDETIQRIRSVHDERYHYIRTLSAGPTFASLNRYKEKCFPILPMMRQMHIEGRLTGPARELMERRGPCEELYDTRADRDEIHNLLDSTKPEHQTALMRLRTALDVWMFETGDRGSTAEPADVVAPFAKEMHDWFGTPAWAASLNAP